MKPALLIFLLTLPVHSNTVFCQQLLHEGGSYASGPGGIMTEDPAGPWNVVHNPAGLATTENFSLGIYANQRFNAKNLYNGTFAVSFPTSGSGGGGLAYSSFAHENYHIEQNGRIAYGMKLAGFLRAGIHLDYLHRRIHPAQSYHMITGGAGTLFQISHALNSGLYVYNPFGITANSNNSLIPHTRFVFTINYSFNNFLQTELHAVKSSGTPVSPGIKILYSPAESLTLHKGISIQPYANAFSAIFRFSSLRISISFGWHPYLGFTPGMTLDYIFL